jgi:hypothetical protein
MLKKDLIKRFVKLSREVHMIEQELGLIVDAKGTEKKIKYCPELYKESLKNTNLERHLFIPDLHIPDQNKEAVKSILNFIPDFKPTNIHLLGDVLDFQRASDFLILDNNCPTLGQEIKETRAFLRELMEKVDGLEKKPEIAWYCGNHEKRLEKFLAKGGHVLDDIEEESGEQLISIPNIFNLKGLGIKWIPDYELGKIGEVAVVQHGRKVSSKSGYTASAQMDKYGISGVSGHTHRFAIITRTFRGDVKWWIEGGSLCNLEPSSHYVDKPNWANAFAIGIFDKKNNLLYPTPVLMQNNTFWFGEKIYRPTSS